MKEPETMEEWFRRMRRRSLEIALLEGAAAVVFVMVAAVLYHRGDRLAGLFSGGAAFGLGYSALCSMRLLRRWDRW